MEISWDQFPLAFKMEDAGGLQHHSDIVQTNRKLIVLGLTSFSGNTHMGLSRNDGTY